MSKYGTIPHNEFEALLNKMGGQIKMKGEEAMRAYLRGEYQLTPTVEDHHFKTWKTIKLGTVQTADCFRKDVVKAGMKIDVWANEILDKVAFTGAKGVTEVELVVCSVADLGFKDQATRRSIYARARDLGLHLCPPEVGPQLRLQYADQSNEESLLIAMDPIIDLNGYQALFYIQNVNSIRRLSASFGFRDDLCGEECRFVFLRRNKN
jgi:hypothetical protein